MTARTSTRATAVFYLFNADWDRAIGNVRDQLGRPCAPGGDAAPSTHLEYLVHGLRTWTRHHGPGAPQVEVGLVEISPDGLGREALEATLRRRVPGLAPRVVTVPRDIVQAFLDEAARVPVEHYRSPNRLHEALMMRRLRDATEQRVGFFDPDVTFVADRAADLLYGYLDAYPDRWAAGFLEQGKQIPWRGEWLAVRPRLHSVAVVFDAQRMRQHFPLALFSSPTGLEARLAGLASPEACAFYRSHAVLDTFSLVTEYLRANWGQDRLFRLDGALAYAHEGRHLTIVSELVIHCKYRLPGARAVLQEALDRSGLAAARLPDVDALLAECAGP